MIFKVTFDAPLSDVVNRDFEVHNKCIFSFNHKELSLCLSYPKGSNAGHQRRAQAIELERGAVLRVRCMPLLGGVCQ